MKKVLVSFVCVLAGVVFAQPLMKVRSNGSKGGGSGGDTCPTPNAGPKKDVPMPKLSDSGKRGGGGKKDKGADTGAGSGPGGVVSQQNMGKATSSSTSSTVHIDGSPFVPVKP